MRKAASFRRSMTRRFVGIVLALAVGLLALGGLNAQAGTISLPATLADLEGNSAIVGNLEFSNVTYTVDEIPAGSTPGAPSASSVTVNPFSITGETGIQFVSAFTAAANSTVDYLISYTVTTTDGSLIKDAYLSLGGLTNNGGTGSVSIGETIHNSSGTQVLSKTPFEVYTPGQGIDTTPLTPPETTIIVQKDITVVGGSLGATFSLTNQGYSTVREPASMALLGIGLSGLFTLRRLFRASVAWFESDSQSS